MLLENLIPFQDVLEIPKQCSEMFYQELMHKVSKH